MKISIITPSYNQGSYIEDTILSIKNQNYRNIEHIIVDAGSTDNTVSILKKYEGTYNMKWVSEPDKGQSDAINKGVKMSSGDILGWLNSDDVYIFTDTVSVIMDSFNKTDNEVVFGDLAFINKEGEISTFYSHQKFNYKKIINGRQTLGQPAVFLRKNVLLDNPIRIDLNFAMDFELWTRIGNKYKFKHIYDPVACPRIYPETKSGTQINKQSENVFLKERISILSKFGGQERINIFKIVNDKMTRGGISRLIGLFYLIKNKYIYKRELAFKGHYKKFPQDMEQQLFFNPLLNYFPSIIK